MLDLTIRRVVTVAIQKGESVFLSGSLLQAPRTREEILAILGDTKDQQYPIWRSGSDNEYTLCTALFDLQKENVEVFFSNPKEGMTNRYLNLRLRSNQTLVNTS